MKKANIKGFSVVCPNCKEKNVNAKIEKEIHNFGKQYFIRLTCLSCDYKDDIK